VVDAKKTIHIVEDDPQIADGLNRSLLKAGFNVVWSKAAYEALKLYKDGFRPNLAILDVNLEVAGAGLALAGVCNKNGVRCFINTGRDTEELDRDLALSQGAIFYFHKPVDPDLLAMQAKNILEPRVSGDFDLGNGFSFSPEKGNISKNGIEVKTLSSGPALAFALLLKSEGRACTVKNLIAGSFDSAEGVSPGVVYQYIYRLNKGLKEVGVPLIVDSVTKGVQTYMLRDIIEADAEVEVLEDNPSDYPSISTNLGMGGTAYWQSFTNDESEENNAK